MLHHVVYLHGSRHQELSMVAKQVRKGQVGLSLAGGRQEERMRVTQRKGTLLRMDTKA